MSGFFHRWEENVNLKYNFGKVTNFQCQLSPDHSIRSLVRVTGNHVQGLFNYLLNDRSMVPTVGEFSGVPPTLLSPTVFVGGTVRHNQVGVMTREAITIENRGHFYSSELERLYKFKKKY